MTRFWIAPFLPVGLLVVACFFSGWWSVAALLSVTAFVIGMDRALSPAVAEGDASQARMSHVIIVGLGLAHMALMPLGVWALTRGGALEGVNSGMLALALGLFFGQVSNSNAHELIHRTDRWSRRLGIADYSSLLFGHHTSAHPLVHHVYVATPKDPNSAPLGMGFYRFWLSAWIGSFRAGWVAENERRRGRTKRRGVHPYVIYITGATSSLMLGYFIAGIAGTLIWAGLAVYATMQLMLSDYVQHYGLRRAQKTEGGWMPIGPQHSWNAPHWYSSALMLNAPCHSDHHAHPARHFHELRLDNTEMPMLPRSLPVMAAIALVPPLWRRMMDHRVNDWAQPAATSSQNAQLTAISVGSSSRDLPV